MATLEMNSIRDYLIKVGYKIEYPILVNAFKQYLYNPDPNIQGEIRTRFKDYVNRLATVSIENNMKFIILRPDFRPVPAITGTTNGIQEPIKPLLVKQNNIVVSEAKSSTDHRSNPHPMIHTLSHEGQIPMAPKIHQHDVPPPPIPQHQRYQQPPISHNNQPPRLMTPPKHNTIRSPKDNINVVNPSLPLKPITVHKNNIQQLVQTPTQQPHPLTPRPTMTHKHYKQSQQQHATLSATNNSIDTHDGVFKMPLPPTPIPKRDRLLTRPESINLSKQQHVPPPRPPPRRRQSTASLFKQTQKPVERSLNEIHDLAKRSFGKVKEHALKLNSSFNTKDLNNSLMPKRSNTMKENRLSRDSTISSISSTIHRNGLQLSSTNSHRPIHRSEDGSDSSSIQPIDPLKKKWALEACNCNHDGLVSLLEEDPKLASSKDIVNGYTALHWAAKFGNVDIIRLIAGTYGVSPDIKSSAGYTPLHVAYLFNRVEIANLLLQVYNAKPDVRDHSGKRPLQYLQQQ